MKPTTILTLAATCFAPLIINSCSTDPEYREWKKNKQSDSANNPYGVPQAGGETGVYTPSGQTPSHAAPYQPLPGVNPPVDPPAQSEPFTGGATHTVVTGDSLWGIARKYGTTIEAIQAANSLTTTTIRTGQQLSIPGR